MASASASKITRESFSKPLIDIINLEVFDNDAKRGELSGKEYQVPVHQRFPRWNKKSWERLVDSVMQDYPMSCLLMTQQHIKYEEKPFQVNYIQDGQTRLSILQDYIKGVYDWNGKRYGDLTDIERSRFDGYPVRIELIKKKTKTTDEEFKNICRDIFARINDGKPLTDNDKVHNCMDEPILQLVMKFKHDPRFCVPLKKIFGDIGGGKRRSGLANMVGLVLAILTHNSECITPSYAHNSQYIISDNGTAVHITPAGIDRVHKFFEFYIELVMQFKETYKLKTMPGFFKKISGPVALILTDWLSGLATERRNVWVYYIEKMHQVKDYEKRIYACLEKGVIANNSAVNFQKRIKCVIEDYDARTKQPNAAAAAAATAAYDEDEDEDEDEDKSDADD